MAEPDLAGPGDLDPLYPPRAQPGPVGAAQILQQPLAAVQPEDGVLPGDPRLIYHEI
jgi:hypothetical protein